MARVIEPIHRAASAIDTHTYERSTDPTAPPQIRPIYGSSRIWGDRDRLRGPGGRDGVASNAEAAGEAAHQLRGPRRHRVRRRDAHGPHTSIVERGETPAVIGTDSHQSLPRKASLGQRRPPRHQNGRSTVHDGDVGRDPPD